MSNDRTSPEDEHWAMFSGIQYPDGSIVLAPLFPASRARDAGTVGEGGANTLAVDFLDEDGGLRGRTIVVTEPVCVHRNGPGESLPRTFGRVIAVPRGTRTVRLSSVDGDVLKTLPVSEHRPEVELEWARPDEDVEGVATLAWRASHPDGLGLTFLVTYSHDGRRWQTLSLPERWPALAIDFDELPGGPDCRLRVAASDGFNVAVSETAPFPVARKGVRPLIVAVEPGPPVPVSEQITFRGQALDLENNVFVSEDFRWISSRDGELGSGGVLTTRLSPGLHHIRLEVGDQRERAVGLPEAAMELQVVPSTYAT